MPGLFKDKISLLMIGLLAGTAAFFISWALGHTAGSSVSVLLLSTGMGMFMAFNIGGNDVTNSFGTSVGAGTLTIKQALIVAAIFEVSGAVIAGGEVTDTIRSGIVDLSELTADPAFDAMDFIFIMLSALFAAAAWLLIATKQGWPVSTTHSIVGGIVGSSITLGVLALGGDQALQLVHWEKIGTIALSWVLSPLLGGLAAYLLFFNIKKHVLEYNEKAEEKLNEIHEERQRRREEHRTAMEAMTELQRLAYTGSMSRDSALVHVLRSEGVREVEPETFESDYYRDLYSLSMAREEIHANRALEHYVPALAALGSMIITSMLLFKGLKHAHIGLSNLQNILVILMVAAAVWMAVYILAKGSKHRSLDTSTFLLFSWMQVFTAAGFAFSHGSNDIANAIGPFAAILDVLHSGEINSTAPVPMIAMVSFGIALVAGLWFIGKEVIATVGTHLTKMHPASGFAAELSAAGVVMLASTLGIPVSSTHILVGAVLGIGIVNRSANWALMKPIGLAWIITLPAAASLASLGFLALRWMY